MIKFSLFSQGESLFYLQENKFSSASNKSFIGGKQKFQADETFVYREERVGWSERFHSLISSLIVSFTDMMRVVRQALLPAKA